jgi:serine/threonine protein kinase
MYQIACGLEYLHNDKELIHRDIKGDNIICDNQKLVIIDFGSGKKQERLT